MHLSPDMWAGSKVTTVGSRPAQERESFNLLERLKNNVGLQLGIVGVLMVGAVFAPLVDGIAAQGHQVPAQVQSVEVIPAHTNFVTTRVGKMPITTSQAVPEQYAAQVTNLESGEAYKVLVERATYEALSRAKPDDRFVLALQEGRLSGMVYSASLKMKLPQAQSAVPPAFSPAPKP